MKGSMLQEVDLINGICKLLSRNNIISISGESGTGKTTLSLYLVGNLLTYNKSFTDSCIWIQASEIFPKKRLSQIFGTDLKKLEYIQNNIWDIQNNSGPIGSFEEQKKIMEKLSDPAALLPPSLRYIVIDNISHHLRYKLQHIPNGYSLLDRFYDEQLLPLILFCKREHIHLILIHEVTYSPKLDRVRPFFFSLYDRIEKIDIVLHKIFNSEKKMMEISHEQFNWNFQYMLVNSGIEIV